MYQFKEGFYADIRIEDRLSTLIRYMNKSLNDFKERLEKRAFIRVYDGTMWYYSSTTDINGIQEELDKLYLSAIPNQNILLDPVIKKMQINVDNIHVFTKNSLRNVSKEDKQQLLLKYLPLIYSSSYIKMSMGQYIDRSSEYEFYSSLGSNIKYDYQNAGIILGGILVNETEKFQGSFQYADTDFEKLNNLDEEIIKEFKKSEEFLLKAKKVVPGEYPVVLSPLVAGVFAHESFGHKSEADFMLGDENMKKEWVIGKKVGSEILTIGDTGKDLGSGYVPYDDEGTKASETYLIKNGILNGRLHSSVTAAYLDECVTGNARAIDCTFEPIVRMTNTFIGKGQSTFNDLVKDIKEGYYIENLSYGTGMSQFTIAPTLAYEIKDGKIGDPVKISVITGNVFETLSLIDGLSNDVHIFSFVGGGCGKIEQYPLNVAFGGPYVRVSKMQVQ